MFPVSSARNDTKKYNFLASAILSESHKNDKNNKDSVSKVSAGELRDWRKFKFVIYYEEINWVQFIWIKNTKSKIYCFLLIIKYY